ncbi:hypothetical protein C8N41_102193 [Winogradskyella sediminis]|nr:hypothetical protein C8N41_102193 [Winogradskyella sediminis]
MNPIKKCARIIPATIYSVKFESSLMTLLILTNLPIHLNTNSYKGYI